MKIPLYKHLPLLTCAVLTSLSLIAGAPKAQAQCNCLSADTSVSILCDTCWVDTIIWIGVFPHQISDTGWACDTCYSFALKNNCSQAISALQIYDSNGTGGLKRLHHGCAVIQLPTADTSWKAINNSDGSISFDDTDGAGKGCLQPGETIIISICNPLHRGDSITIAWWDCDFPPPAFPQSCPNPPGETLVVP